MFDNPRGGSCATETKAAGMDLNQKNKQRVWEFWQALEGTHGVEATAVSHQYMSGDVRWHGPDPLLDLFEVEGFVEGFWQPLQISFSGLERRVHIFLGGASSGRADGGEDGRMWVAGSGLFEGRFIRDYLSIPANGEAVQIRWGEFCRLDRGRIVEVFCLLDLVDLMKQAGSSVLPTGHGELCPFPPPAAGDGIMLDIQSERESRLSQQHTRQSVFEGQGGQGRESWQQAFPDSEAQDLDALIAEGFYSAAAGWDGLQATHRGEYLGVAATGNRVQVNGLEFWKREGGTIIESWLLVDNVHLFRQLGVDLFERTN